MAGAFWCVVEDDRQGMPKKVMAEALGEAGRLSGGNVEAVWLTDKASDAGIKQLGEWGASKVWLLENPAFAPYRGEVWAPVVAELAGKESPKAILGPVTSRQRELLARVAARLGVGLCPTGLFSRWKRPASSARGPRVPVNLLRRDLAKGPWVYDAGRMFRPRTAAANSAGRNERQHSAAKISVL